jgi:hypothetical protein
MFKQVIAAAALGGGVLLFTSALPGGMAEANPLPPLQLEKPDGVTLVGRRGGGRSGMRGGGRGGASGLSRGGRVGMGRSGGRAPRALAGRSGGNRGAIRSGRGAPRAIARSGGNRGAIRSGRGAPRAIARSGGSRQVHRDRSRDFKAPAPRRHARVDRRHRHVDRSRRFRGYALYGAPLVYGYGVYAGCGWLYEQAIATGDPYWWERYETCRYGYAY